MRRLIALWVTSMGSKRFYCVFVCEGVCVLCVCLCVCVCVCEFESAYSDLDG